MFSVNFEECRGLSVIVSALAQDAEHFSYVISATTPSSELLDQWGAFIQKPTEWFSIADVVMCAFLASADLTLALDLGELRITTVEGWLTDLLPDSVLAEWVSRKKTKSWDVLFTPAAYSPSTSHMTLNHFTSMQPASA